jgi:hypothetical protein
MSDLTRKDLETQAKHEICACYYYDLCDSIDGIDDKELQDIINIPLYSHLQDYLGNYDAIDVHEFMEVINNCYNLSYKSKTDYKMPEIENMKKLVENLPF